MTETFKTLLKCISQYNKGFFLIISIMTQHITYVSKKGNRVSDFIIIMILFKSVYPLDNYESYINILNTSKDFIKEYFSYFLQGGAPNLNLDAYTRLCKVANIEALLNDIDAIADNYVKWIYDPDTVYPGMLFDYPRD